MAAQRRFHWRGWDASRKHAPLRERRLLGPCRPANARPVARVGIFCLSSPHSGTHARSPAVLFCCPTPPLPASSLRAGGDTATGRRRAPPRPPPAASSATTNPLPLPGRKRPRRTHSPPATVQNRKKSAPASGGGAEETVVPPGDPPPRTSHAGSRPRRPHPRWRSVGHRRCCAQGHPWRPLVAGAGAVRQRRATAQVAGDAAAEQRKPRRRRRRRSRQPTAACWCRPSADGALIRRRCRASWSRPS